MEHSLQKLTVTGLIIELFNFVYHNHIYYNMCYCFLWNNFFAYPYNISIQLVDTKLYQPKRRFLYLNKHFLLN